MLSKLAYRNAKRSLKDYLVYLITITISFSLILAFSLVSNSDAVTSLSFGMDSFKNVLTFVNCVIVFVVCFLINYTTKFMFEKRSKELGMYMLLGIKKTKIAKMFVTENIILGFLALILSIPCGFIFSQFISLVIVKILGIPEVIFISFNAVSIGSLAICFLVIYTLVLFNLLCKIRKMTIHHFLYLEKQNEKKMFQSNRKRNLIFLFSLVLGAACLIVWHSRFQESAFSQTETLTVLIFSMIGLIASIYGISATISDMILSWILKNPKLKYQKDHLFVARTFASKARTMSFTFGTLSMLILISVLSLNFSGLNKAGYHSSIELEAPYDVTLFDDKESFDEYIEVIAQDYTINETIAYDIYKDPANQIQPLYSYFNDFDSLITLSDYNRLRKLRNMESVSLSEDEYLIVTSSQKKYLVDDNDHLEHIQLSNGFSLHLKGIDTESFWNRLNSEEEFVMVVPDRCIEGLEISESHLIVDTAEETTNDLKEKINHDMAHHLCKTDEDGDVYCQYYRVMVRGTVIEEQNTMTAMLASICLYIAFILTSAVGTILAIQSLSDAAKYKYRYMTLRRLGVNDSSLYRTIRKQLGILFSIPVAYPVICCFFMMTSVNHMYQFVLESKWTYLLYFAGSLAVFLLIYGIYWITTYIGFKRNINEES
ncbi:MAG: ABC transporter permease [Eubacteriales bacterium]|nr:ABC transporter permease [Eubacteriales bacterium]